MNILFLMKVFEVGGQEVVTSTLAHGFTAHGHHVTIACFKRRLENFAIQKGMWKDSVLY